MAKLKFKNGISGTLEDWTNTSTQFSVGSVKRRLESRNPGEAGLIVYDKLGLTFGYEAGNNPVYNNFSGDLSAVQKYIFEYYGVKSDKSESKLFEGLADLSTLEWPDLEKKVSFSVLDKLSSLSLISNSLSQRGTPITVSSRVDPAAQRITFFSGRGSGGTLPGYDWNAFGNCGDESIIMPFHDNGSYWGMPDVPQGLIVNRGETIRDNAGDLYFVADSWIAAIPSSLANSIGYSVAGNWVRLVKKQEAVTLIQGTTAAAIYPSTYYDKTEEFIDVIGSQDANGRYPVVAFNVINIIRCLIENVWGTATILNDSNDVFPISLDYYTQLIDENPFGMHSLDAIKMLAGSINSYIYFNKLGELVLRKKTNISAGTVRTFNLSAKKSGGKKKYFWDKLADAVTVTVKSGKTINGVTIQGSATLKKIAGISPRNELKLEVVAPNNIETTESALNAYALTVATEVMDFYGKRHFYFNLSTRLLDEMLDWDLLDLIDLNGERYFILSSDINETTSSATFELVSVTGYDYDFQQARAILSTEKYNSTIIGVSSSSSSGTTTTISITALQPLEMVGTEIKLNYEDNLKLSVANKLDTAQPIKITATPQFARLGVGGAADATIPFKVYGDSKITGNLTVDGNFYIGGNINQVNVVDLDVADHAIRLNKNGDDTTALQGGVEMLGTSNILIGSIKYNGTAWLSDLNIDIANGKTYKINNVDVLSATGLGTSVVSSSLTSIGTLNHDLNIANTKVYKINNAQVLSATALGSTVIGSSLTSVGTLTIGVWNATAITDTYIASAASWNSKEAPLTFSYPLSRLVNTISLGYNTTNLKLTSNQLNTIQDIATTASPIFTNITLTGTLDQQGTGTSYFGSQSVLPKAKSYTNLGSLAYKFLSLHVAELSVETLVAQNTQATIGGRILVGSTTILLADLSAYASTMDVKYSLGTSGTVVCRLEVNGAVEYISVNLATQSTITGGYRYSITKGLNGSYNAWNAGDAVFSTGTTGTGFIDVYSINNMKSATILGPSIVGNIRNSSTYNDWSEAWAIGNLNGLYGYSSDVFGVGLGKYSSGITNITVDPTNGYRVRNYSDVIAQWDNTGKITLGKVANSNSRMELSGNSIRFIYRNASAVDADIITLDSVNQSMKIFVGDDPFWQMNIGQTAGGINFTNTGFYGMSAVNSDGDYLFRLDNGVQQIAGWNFDSIKFAKGTSSVGMSLNSSAYRFIANSGKGFEVWNPTDTRIFAGELDSSGNLSKGFAWNLNDTTDYDLKFVVKGDVMGSRFSTSTSFNWYDLVATAAVVINGGNINITEVYGGTQFNIAMEGYKIALTNSTSTYKTILINSSAGSISIGGQSLGKCYGLVTAPPNSSTENLQLGDYCLLNNNMQMAIFDGTNWNYITYD